MSYRLCPSPLAVSRWSMPPTNVNILPLPATVHLSMATYRPSLSRSSLLPLHHPQTTIKDLYWFSPWLHIVSIMSVSIFPTNASRIHLFVRWAVLLLSTPNVSLYPFVLARCSPSRVSIFSFTHVSHVFTSLYLLVFTLYAFAIHVGSLSLVLSPRPTVVPPVCPDLPTFHSSRKNSQGCVIQSFSLKFLSKRIPFLPRHRGRATLTCH